VASMEQSMNDDDQYLDSAWEQDRWYIPNNYVIIH
jgi:hypothetical protein